MRRDKGASIAENGALLAYSGAKTRRSLKDKRGVRNPQPEQDVCWGSVNVAIDELTYDIGCEPASNYLTFASSFTVRRFRGSDPKRHIKLGVICFPEEFHIRKRSQCRGQGSRGA